MVEPSEGQQGSERLLKRWIATFGQPPAIMAEEAFMRELIEQQAAAGFAGSVSGPLAEKRSWAEAPSADDLGGHPGPVPAEHVDPQVYSSAGLHTNSCKAPS
jgi:hypothetical protein